MAMGETIRTRMAHLGCAKNGHLFLHVNGGVPRCAARVAHLVLRGGVPGVPSL
jgi:hypothetical protein